MSATEGSTNLLSSFSFRSKEPIFAGSGSRDLSGLTLDAVLGTEKPKPTPPPQLYPSPSYITRTLLEIIRDEEPDSYLADNRDRKAWRSFKDRLKLRRAGNTWTASHPVPVSDGPIRNFRKSPQNSTRSHPYCSEGSTQCSVMDGEEGPRRVQFRDFPNETTSRPMMTRRSSTRLSGPGESGDPDDSARPTPLRAQFSRHNSTRMGSSRAESGRFLARCESSVAPKDELSMERSDAEDRLARLGMAEERQMSAREAAAAQEAAEAVAAAEAKDEEDSDEGSESGNEPQPMRMSLMDLLEETDKEMGWEGSKYMVGDDEYEDEDYDEEEEDDEEDEVAFECSCNICMVKHRGQPLVPCGHSYCKLCTKEMYVSRSNCPICNDFILEILTVF